MVILDQDEVMGGPRVRLGAERSRASCPYAVIALLRILTSAIKILGDNRFLLSTVKEAAPYTNIRYREGQVTRRPLHVTES